ncbi:MAG TPA: hypothetical protein VFK48_01620 [Usitatibacter sp.]|nr:hypothetical protein [Usitatibacter sp.]
MKTFGVLALVCAVTVGTVAPALAVPNPGPPNSPFIAGEVAQLEAMVIQLEVMKVRLDRMLIPNPGPPNLPNPGPPSMPDPGPPDLAGIVGELSAMATQLNVMEFRLGQVFVPSPGPPNMPNPGPPDLSLELIAALEEVQLAAGVIAMMEYPSPGPPTIAVRDAFQSVIAAAARIESWQGPIDI